jgi:ubiquinone/menaquinone biosynthesis C-methylase UbiE
MQNSEVFWDKMARGYAESRIKDIESYDQTMARTRTHLNPGDRALELGCGTGTTALRLADAVSYITATDISSEMIGIAQGKALRQGVENVAFGHADIADSADPDGPFDVVMGFNLLHLIEDLPTALAAINGMLKPGGLFISKSGCMAEKTFYMRPVIAVMQMFGKAPYVANLKVRALEALITGAGFEIIDTHTYPGMVANRFVVARKV